MAHFAHPVVSSLIHFFALICCIHLCDWSFRLYHQITHICYFVASCLLLLFYSFESFSHQHQQMFFHWSDSKSPQVYCTLLYFGRSKQRFRLDGLHSCSYFQFFQFRYQSFGDSSERTDYNWYHSHFHVPFFSQFPCKVQVRIFLFAFLQFYSMVCPNGIIIIIALLVGLRTRWLYLLQRGRKLKNGCPEYGTNWIWWWSSRDLGNVRYPFITITPSSIQTRRISTC